MTTLNICLKFHGTLIVSASADLCGRVVATAFPSVAVAFAPALARSLRAHPELTLVLRQTSAREGLGQVRSGEVDVAPLVLSEFEGTSTIVSLVANGIGIAILPRLAVSAGERRVAVRDLPHGLDLARDIYAVTRTASVRRPSVAVIVTALRAAAKALPARTAEGAGPRRTQA